MALTAYFGETPRIRVLEAILRLAPFESFTMKEVAQEADLFPPSTYRTIRGLAKDGFLEVAESGRPLRFRVPRGSADIQLLSLIDAATTQLRSPVKLRPSDSVVRRFRTLAGAVARSEITSTTTTSDAQRAAQTEVPKKRIRVSQTSSQVS